MLDTVYKLNLKEIEENVVDIILEAILKIVLGNKYITSERTN